VTQQSSDGLVVTFPSDVEIKMVRVFDAPRELVFEAHTSCEHVTRWWGQRASKLTCEMDFRPGGSYRFVDHSGDGREDAFRGEYREIVAPEKIVQTFEYEPMAGHIVEETLLFSEEDGKTVLTNLSVYPSKEDRDGMVASGMESGAAESLDQLEEYLRTMA
jgi:uncharacterized protein YndB with AHSA1/START domain